MRLLPFLFIIFSSTAVSQSPPQQSIAPVLQNLKIGQKVTIFEKNGLYKIEVLDAGTLGNYEVLDLTSSYLGLSDIVGISYIRIPVTSISAITVTKINQKTK